MQQQGLLKTKIEDLVGLQRSTSCYKWGCIDLRRWLFIDSVH